MKRAGTRPANTVVVEILQTPLLHSVRQSARSLTVASKRELQKKLIEDQKRRALLPQKSKVVEAELTQEEKLAEAQETERQNLASLERMIQIDEENRRKRAQRARERVGPVIRYKSTKVNLIEEVNLDVESSPTDIAWDDSVMDVRGSNDEQTTGGRHTDGATAGDSDTREERMIDDNSVDKPAAEEAQQRLPPPERYCARNLLIFDKFSEDPFTSWRQKVGCQ